MISACFGRFIAPVLLRMGRVHIGENPRFAGWVTLYGGGNVAIGDDFFAGSGLYISTSKFARVFIGDAVMLGPNVSILGGNHDLAYNQSHMRYNQVEDKNAKNISIETGAWIGANSVILSGASVGEGAAVGAAAVVNCSVPPYTVAVGNNMRIIRCRFETIDELRIALSNCQSKYSLEELLLIYAKSKITLHDER